MNIKPKQYLEKTMEHTYLKDGIEYTESNKQYFQILNVDDNKIEIMEFIGTPFANEVMHPYDEINNNYSIVVISQDEIKTESVTEAYIHNNVYCQKVIGIKYKWHDKELTVYLPQVYFNGKDFIDIPKDFYWTKGEEK